MIGSDSPLPKSTVRSRVGNLSEKEFAVLDNKSRGSIASFTRLEGKDAPVRVVIVVDAVNTPYVYLAYQRDQIARHLRSNDGVLPYPTTFAVLSDKNFRVYKGISKDGKLLAKALERTHIGLRTIQELYSSFPFLIFFLASGSDAK